MAKKKLKAEFPEFISRLRQAYREFPMKPMAAEFRRQGRSVYEILISTVLSLRTKDPTTYEASYRLFDQARTPFDMIKLSKSEIEKLIFPVGFYRVKAEQILRISKILIDKYDGKIPKDRVELMKLPGVGLKTANLVLAEGFLIPKICVDTHVQRISNRLDLVRTKTPEETEKKLHKIIPEKYWIDYSDLIVAYGQNICTPLSPFCDSKCVVKEFCPRRGVKKSR